MKTTSSRNWTTAGAKESQLGAHFSVQALKASDTRPGARSLFALLPLTSPSRESGFRSRLMLAFSPVFAFLIALLLNLTITTLFSHSAYATDISISSSGKVSFGKVQPSSIGTLVTGEDELSISTTCSEGVSVYATSVNNSESGTSLINEAAKILDTSGTNESAYTISTSTNTVGSGSATALTNNTWGLNTNAEEAGNNLYYGLPAYSASSLPPAIYTGALPAGTGDAYTGTVPVYYGAKVTNTLVPGTYTGEVLYTVTVNTACLNYTVTFDKNAEGASGTMENQTILPAGGNLRENTFEYSGYTFLGWSTSPEGKTGTAVDGIGTEADVEYENEALFPDATTSPDIKPGDDVTLYAIWEKDGYGEDTMQGWTGCAALAANASVTLTDVRDEKQYVVKKLPDGKCWMMQNLTLNGVELTPNDTNIADGNTYYLPKDGGAGSLTDPATKNKTTGYNFASGYDNQAMFKFRAKNSSYTNDSDTGYYNFYTATLGFSYYNDGKTYGTSTQDICPVNWHLPRVPNNGSNSITSIGSDNDFTYLARQYTGSWSGTSTTNNYYTTNSTAMNAMYKSAASPLATSTANNYAGFSYSGLWNSTSGSAGDVGSSGRYWSASVYSTYDGYYLRFNSSNIYPQNRDGKYYGFAVRCVREPSYMQDFDSSTLADGATTTLIDKRDGQAYTVYRIPSDAMYPGTSTIANVAGKVIMTKDLNLGAVNSVPGSASTITANGTMTLSPEDSGFTTPTGSGESITVPTGNVTVNASYSSTDRYSNKYYQANGTGSYANRGYYSWGAAMVSCPKGWRLPTQDEYNNSSSWNASTTGISKLVNNSLSTIQQAPYSFVLGGFYGNGWDYAGSYGYYWSSTQFDSSGSYYLNMYSSYGLVRNGRSKSDGFSVRCMAE